MIPWPLVRRAAEMALDAYGAPSMATVHGNVRTIYLPGSPPLHGRPERPPVLAVAGTDDLKDALQDADVRRTAGAHHGMLEHARTVAEMWVERLERDAERSGLVVTGHSLGGAAAVLFAHITGWRVRVVTFGAPRALTRAGAAKFRAESSARVLRLERAGDPVPHLPSAVTGWRHVGERRLVGGSWWLTAARFATSRWGGAVGALKDHSMRAYLADVKRHAPNVAPIAPEARENAERRAEDAP